jgi:hypothetical protein
MAMPIRRPGKFFFFFKSILLKLTLMYNNENRIEVNPFFISLTRRGEFAQGIPFREERASIGDSFRKATPSKGKNRAALSPAENRRWGIPPKL